MSEKSCGAELQTQQKEEQEEPREQSPHSVGDNNNYMVLVKPEFLLPRPKPQVVQQRKGDSGEIAGSVTQKSKKRPRDAREDGLEKLCGQTRKGEECPYGDSCRFR